MIEYLEVRGHFETHKYEGEKSRQQWAIFYNIEEFINPNNISVFYPKNMFVEDENLEIYIFLERKILRGRIIDDGRIEIKVLFLKDIKDFICECIYDGEYYHKLTFEFINGEIIELDSMLDTNFSWRNKFEKTIKEIIKKIIILDCI